MVESLHPDPAARRSARLRPLTRVLVILFLLSPLAFAVPQLVLPDPAETATLRPTTMSTMPHSSSAPPATRPADLLAPARSIDDLAPVIGFALNCHHIGDLDRYLTSIDRIASLGANTLVIVTPMYQHRVDSSEIRFLPDKCATDEQLVTLLTHARTLGLRTAVQPIVLIEDPGEHDWRGVIEPADWDAWWLSYDALIDRFLRIADRARVDLFCIGSELNTTEPQYDRWRRVIQTVRARFSGVITYSANWDRYAAVDLWNLVDIVSVSSYFELSPEDHDATLETLVAAWVVERDRLTGFARSWRRPLMLSEVGYPSLPWAAGHPWNYVPKGKRADHDAQARCYRAFFEAWTPEVTRPSSDTAGFVCYRWDPYHDGGRRDTGYGISGKPSEAIVREGFARIRETLDSSNDASSD